MAFQKAIFISFGLSAALALSACSSDKNPEGAGGMNNTLGGSSGTGVGGTGAGGAPAGGTGVGGTGVAGTGTAGAGTGMGEGPCKIDWTQYTASTAPVSFKNDVMPAFGLSCVVSDCHNSGDTNPRAGLPLGPKCGFDAATKK